MSSSFPFQCPSLCLIGLYRFVLYVLFSCFRCTSGLHCVVNTLYLIWCSLLLSIDFDTDFINVDGTIAKGVLLQNSKKISKDFFFYH